MGHIRWGMFLLGLFSFIIFVIAFFQNFDTTYYASWRFLFVQGMTGTSGIVMVVGFIFGVATTALLFLSVKGGRYDPNTTGKEHPDSWERIADQY